MAISANRQSFSIKGKNSEVIQSPVDCIINHLLEERQRVAEYKFLEERDRFDDQRDFWLSSEIEQLCLACSDIFLKESSLLELKAPIKIAGDLHGQFNTLLSIFEHDGLPLLPPQSTYLFLGNHGDRAGHQLDTVALLLALKIKYPENMFLLRGSHDGAQSRILVDECELDLFPLFESFNNCLSCLPLAALINDKIICTHGGLPLYQLHHLDQIRHIERPCRYVPKSGLLRDLIESHPSMTKTVVNRLNHGLRLICCDYKVVGGYRVLPGLVTICSASRMEFSDHRLPEVGAMMSVDAQLMYSFRNLDLKIYSGVTLITHALRRTSTIKCGEDLPPEKPSERSPSDSNSGSITDTSKCESSSSGEIPSNKLLTKYTSVVAGFKRFLGARV